MDFSSYTAGQERSVRHLDGPLLVSAGAGSGKTFTLTQRIAWALLPGSGTDGAPFLGSIDEALVITFTEKAAAEIKERIRSTLRAEGMLDEALKVDAAWISTIHGACSRILHEHALEVGLDPAFSVLGATKEEELRMLAIEGVLARAEEGESAYKDLFTLFNADAVRSSVEDLLKVAHTLPDGLDAVDLGPVGTPLAEQARELLALAQEPPECATEKTAASFLAIAEGLRRYLDDPDNIELLSEALATRLGSGKATEEFNPLVMRLRGEVVVAPYRRYAELLVDLARHVEDEYQRILAASGQVDMAGLIRKTLDVFNEYPEIASQYTQRFRLVMVDEFQDTSQLQIDMIERIVGTDRHQLCTVGDAQQSIYRFQGADVSVYLQHKRDMKSGGAEVVQLDDNFRSNADILAFVRRVCGQDGYFPEDFLDLKAAGSGKPFYGDGPRVELSLIPYSSHSSSQVKPLQARNAEARHIAERFAQLHETGHSYSDMVLLLGRMSAAQTYARALREAGLPCVVAGGSKFFDAPHVKTCLSLLGALANPYDATCLLTVLTSEVLPVSTNDLLELSTTTDNDGNPKRQHIAKGLVGTDALPENASPLLVHAQAVLYRAWSKLGHIRPAQLLKETVFESGWLGRMQGGGATEQAKAADVLKFIRLVEEAQQELGFDMARVAREMNNRSQVASEKPGALSVENLDAIRIMTIHASKGLEFPIVAVADCYESRGYTGKAATYIENGKLYLSLAGPGFKPDKSQTAAGVCGAFEPGEFRANMLAADKDREYEEKKRLFYVATTRASAALLVCLCVSNSQSRGYPRLVNDIRAGLVPGAEDFPDSNGNIDYGGSMPMRFIRLVASEEESQDSPQAHPNTLDLPILEQMRAPAPVPYSLRSDFFSYSSLAAESLEQGDKTTDAPPKATAGALPSEETHALSCVRGESVITEPEVASEDATGAAPAFDIDKATDFGSALHRACEWLALQQGEPDSESMDAALARAANEFCVTDHSRLRAAFDRWHASDVRKWALSFDAVQPELPFFVEKDGGILEGEIDLFCTSGSQAGIVDYKTGGHEDETPDQLYEKHLLQAQCYAYAAQQAGYKHVEARFVRVEQEDRTAPGQPQVVTYVFE